ncbi:MAG: alpha/beta hydrolase [Haliea sp.]
MAESVSFPSQRNRIRKSYVDVVLGDNRLQIHFREAGDRCLPPLLLLHQSPSSSVMYVAMMQQLAGHFWLLAPDTPGFGGSDCFELDRPVEVSDYAAAMKAFLDVMGIGPCFVFGHHTGASVAVQLGYDFTDTIKAMSLSGPTYLSAELKVALPGLAETFPLQDDGGHLLSMWKRIRAKDPQADLRLSLRETLLAFSCDGNYPQAYAAVVRQPFAQQLATLKCPVQVFAGDQDPLSDSVDPTLEVLEKGERASVSHGSRTYVCDRQAAEVSGLLKGFFLKC